MGSWLGGGGTTSGAAIVENQINPQLNYSDPNFAQQYPALAAAAGPTGLITQTLADMAKGKSPDWLVKNIDSATGIAMENAKKAFQGVAGDRTGSALSGAIGAGAQMGVGARAGASNVRKMVNDYMTRLSDINIAALNNKTQGTLSMGNTAMQTGIQIPLQYSVNTPGMMPYQSGSGGGLGQLIGTGLSAASGLPWGNFFQPKAATGNGYTATGIADNAFNIGGSSQYSNMTSLGQPSGSGAFSADWLKGFSGGL